MPTSTRKALSGPHGPGNRTPCPGCSRLTDVPLCWKCQAVLCDMLRFAAFLADQLPINIVRLARSQGPYRLGGRSAVIPLPYDADAVEVAWVLADTLGAWGDDLVARGVPYYRDATTGELAWWLADHTLHLARLHDVADCYDEIRDVLGQCLDIVEPARRRQPSDPADAERGRRLFVTAAEAQRYLGAVHGITIKANRIRKWAQRGTIFRIGDYYRVGDILDTLERMSQP